MTDKQDLSYTFREPVRAFFLTVFEPKPFMKDGKSKGEPKFSVRLGIPNESSEVEAMKAKMAEAARAKWPSRPLAELKFPITFGEKAAEKSAAKKKDGKFYLGNVVLTARSKYPPVLSVLEGGKIVTLDSDGLKAKYKNKFYNGCYVAASVNFVAYEGEMGADGVTAYIQSVLWVKDGERIGGRDQAEVFKSYMGTTTDEDPMGDDEIPF